MGGIYGTLDTREEMCPWTFDYGIWLKLYNVIISAKMCFQFFKNKNIYI